MLRKITDLWPGLLGESQSDHLKADEEGSQEQDDEDELQEDLAHDVAEIEAAFKNLNWTRVIAL